MYQYYIIEIQKNTSGEFAHQVHWAFDENEHRARLKAEGKYHEVLAAAATSETLQHSATLVASDGVAVMSQCYVHETVEGAEA